MKKILIKYGKIVNNKFEAFEHSTYDIDEITARNVERTLKDEAYDKSFPVKEDHYVVSAELYSKRGVLKEVHIIKENNEMTDNDFVKFISPYGYVGAIHK